MGDPAGISAEITVNAWSSRSEVKIPPFIFLVAKNYFIGELVILIAK